MADGQRHVQSQTLPINHIIWICARLDLISAFGTFYSPSYSKRTLINFLLKPEVPPACTLEEVEED
jgi:hypothetical protein